MKLSKIIFLSLLFLCSKSVFASAYQGKVTNVFAHAGKVFVTVAGGAFDGPVSCTTTTDYIMLWIEPGTSYGKALISIALTAKTTDRLTWVAGDSTCIPGPSGITTEQLTSMDLKG